MKSLYKGMEARVEREIRGLRTDTTGLPEDWGERGTAEALDHLLPPAAALDAPLAFGACPGDGRRLRHGRVVRRDLLSEDELRALGMVRLVRAIVLLDVVRVIGILGLRGRDLLEHALATFGKRGAAANATKRGSTRGRRRA